MADTSSFLLATKLYLPVQPARFVQRQHLLQRLQQWLSQGYRLTLVSAPAGYGKTMLVVEWIRQENFITAWISLDEGDNDFVRFARYLVGSLRILLPELGESCLQLLDNAQIPSVEGLLTALVNQLTESPVKKPFLMVLDDYHLIHTQAVHDAISFLVEHMPAHGHLVIITRADPPLPLARWRGRGQLNEFRLVDLRFTQAEVQTYLDMTLKLHLSPSDLDALFTRSEGWIAGLQMAAISLRDCDDVAAFLHAMSGSQRNILDYLLEEVLLHLPEKTQDFLIQTSFLERLCGPLCDAVLELSGVSQGILEGLERDNLFIIPMDDHRGWYRYHHLFADLLQTRLYQYPDTAKLADMRSRACQWYESHDFYREAIELCLRGQDYQQAARLIEQIADDMLKHGELITINRWIASLPDEHIRNRPSLCLYHAWALLWSGMPIELINASLQPLKDLEFPISDLQQARLSPLQAFLQLFKGDIEGAIQRAQSALAELPLQDTFLRSMAIIVLASAAQMQDQDDRGQGFHAQAIQESISTGNLLLSIILLSSLANLLQKEGHLEQADKKYRQALELAVDSHGNSLPIATRALVGSATIALERNQISSIAPQIQQAIKLSQSLGANVLVNVYMLMARFQTCLGQEQEAQESLDKASQQARRFDLTEMDDLSVGLYQQRLNLLQMNLPAVQNWVERRGLQGIDPQAGLLTNDFTNAHMRKYEYPILARFYLAQNHPEQALEFMNALLPHVQVARRMGLVIETLILRALALQALGRRSEALTTLTEALEQAEPEGYIRLFVDDSQALHPLLTSLLPRVADKRLANFIDQILNSSSSSGEKACTTSMLVEPLSERELEILRLLVKTSLTAGQIAQELYISVSTVRTHIKSIYGKLGVHGRLEASYCARELKLI
jgi:LuxR family maltose regulon positive regulatory protein